ncbi:MAG: SH3 domain-containing protein [Chloroflexi bacterium]|nr:SH3 domain-containing protein [Chloroflexota bacterium]
MRRIALLALTALFAASATGQDSACPALQESALANIAQLCAEQEAGTLCLGGATVTPVYRDRAEAAASFDQPGGAISITDIDWLSVSSEDRTWGAARALFPAYPSDGLEARDTALLAFGNVALFLPEPMALPPALADIKVTASNGANLRAAPSTDATVVALLAVSRPLKVLGRLRGGGWLQIYATPDLRGWISESVVSAPPVDLPALTADAETVPLWLPWHRFDFLSGMHDAPCEEAPESGILLQTVKFIAPRQFVINGARLMLSGSAWLQAQVSSGLLIHIIDGWARVATDGGEVALRSGNFTHVALARNENGALTPAAPPSDSAAYDFHELIQLPVQALPYETRVGVEVYTIVDPVPAGGRSPLEALAADAPCIFSAARSGANIRSRPDPEAPIIAVMAYRESAEPIVRGIGADSLPWWKLADRIWVRVDATVSGGNCNEIPLIRANA